MSPSGNIASVSYTHEFPMGHRLMNHPGKCRHVHGHNYLVTVMLYGTVNTDTGFVIDFGDLKRAVREVLDPFDHAFCVQDIDPCAQALMPYGMIFRLSFPPTAENLAEWWGDQIALRLKVVRTRVVLQVRETRDCVAEV